MIAILEHSILGYKDAKATGRALYSTTTGWKVLAPPPFYSRRRIEVAFLYGYNASWRGNRGCFVSTT